jgi:hypothetical protein
MKTKVVDAFWGLVLILGGGLFLAQNLGWLNMSSSFWTAAFAGLGVLFLVTYFLNGVQHWGWLFPASIFSATALTLRLNDIGANPDLIAAPILLSVALPFVVAFAMDVHKRWWALIPAWVMVAITSIVFFSQRLQGELIGSFVLYAIALPFFIVYLVDHSKRWALIPASILAVVGLFPLLSTRLEGTVMGAVVVILIGLPFLGAFILSRRNWWALIPAGILGGIGAGLLVGGGTENVVNENLVNGVMMFTWAAVFGALWLLRGSRPTAWAKYPALVFAAIAIVTLAINSQEGIVLPLLVVGAGIVILVANLLPRHAQ